jgi:uncharacterized damage-inducible protein DinB
VRANRLANHRLHTAMAGLSREDFHAPRTSFFPSLAQTLNHILVGRPLLPRRLARRGRHGRAVGRFQPCDTLAELAAAQARADQRFIALLGA